jgi:peptidylprolyl isomerase
VSEDNSVSKKEETTKKGDFIFIDYVGKVKETGETFSTTLEDVAKKEGLHKEGSLYSPDLVVVGEGWVLKGLDEGLIGLKEGQTAAIEIPPEKGFGNRDPSKIKLVPFRKFKDERVAPFPGMKLEMDGKPAVIRSVGAGRVQVDFNPSLAGKNLLYQINLKKVLKRKIEKIKALVERRIPTIAADKLDLNVEGKKVKVNLPEDVFFLEGLQLAKRGINMDIQKFFPEIEELSFIEAFKKKPTEPAGPEPQPKPAEEGKK